jgi:DNA-directed RNA polymerase subunit alpha
MNISISLTPELINLIKAKVRSGRYSSTSEVVREALRTLEHANRRETDNAKFPYRPVEGMPLSMRAFKCLQKANIKYIGELVQRTEDDMFNIPGLGRKSLNEIRGILTDMGLSFGMRLENFPRRRSEIDERWEEQVRREQAEEAKQVRILRRAWKEGIESGDAGELDFDELRATAKRQFAMGKKQ